MTQNCMPAIDNTRLAANEIGATAAPNGAVARKVGEQSSRATKSPTNAGRAAQGRHGLPYALAGGARINPTATVARESSKSPTRAVPGGQARAQRRRLKGRTMKLRTCTALIRKFRDDDGGLVSFEFALWMPVLVAVISLTMQVSMIFLTQSNYWSVSRDTARLVARHAMDETAAETYARDQAGNVLVTPTTDVQLGNATVTVTISAPAASLSPFSAFGFLADSMVVASVTQTLEPT